MELYAEITAAMSAITHGVYVLGVHTPEKDNLMTAAWLCQVSGVPPTLAVAVSSRHLTAELIQKAGGFSVSVLAEDQREIALRNGQVSGRDADKLLGTSTIFGEAGHPLVTGAAAHLECSLTDALTVSDHTLLIGQVVWGALADKCPLLYRGKEFFQ